MARPHPIPGEVSSAVGLPALAKVHQFSNGQPSAAGATHPGRTYIPGSRRHLRIRLRLGSYPGSPKVSAYMNSAPGNGRSLSEILTDMKNELQEFAQTRIELFRNELRERTQVMKSALPLGAAGAIFLATAFFLFSFALVGLLAAVFGDNPYRWFLAALIVGVVWCMAGGTAAFLAKQRVSKRSLMPVKTMQVLSGDKVWLEKETRRAS